MKLSLSLKEDVECKLDSPKYCFISGEELDTIIKKEDFQLIWGVLSGFNKNFTLEEIMKYNLPYAEYNKDIWENPVILKMNVINRFKNLS